MMITKMQWVVENTYNLLSQKFKWADRRTGPPLRSERRGSNLVLDMATAPSG
jgi:hypothetical protein